MSDFIVEAIQAAMKATTIQAAETVQVVQPPDVKLVEKFNEIMATADIRPENQIVQEPTPTRVPFADRVGEAFHAAEARQFETYGKLRELVDVSKTRTMSLTELMEMQYQVANLSIQQELVAKVIDRGSQAIQTLFKNQ
ncbi:MAG: type III secretion system inner rod subunit SctI, partial [Lentisphaeria bacterium]|jgi:type III secretion system YscI/HrpB-like protein|nr:type III secretion system inner rod subunit SctI [Lentisphaeria bacterium]